MENIELSGYSMQSEIRLLSFYINNGIVFNDELYDFTLLDYYALTSYDLNKFMKKALKYKIANNNDRKAIVDLLNFESKYTNTKSLSYKQAIEFVHELAKTSGVGISKLDVDYIIDTLNENYVPVNNYTFAEAINRYIQNLELIPINSKNDLSTVKQVIKL